MSRLARIVGLLIIVGLGIIGVLFMNTLLLDFAAILIAGVVAGLFWRWAS